MNRVKMWFCGLTNSGKIVVVSVATLLLFGTVGTLAQSGNQPANTAPVVTVTPSPEPSPVVIVETMTEVVVFLEETREDGAIAKGQTGVVQEGISGERTISYELTKVEGREVNRKEIKNEITKAPVNKVIAIGTYVAPVVQQRKVSNCDPNYLGACVPIASDVDCAGGSGNGPAYVSGPVRVIGSDIYGLDRDGDGVGCE